MYLSDKQLKEKLGELAIETDCSASDFDANSQIQPASLDLRLSNVFWVPKNRGIVDLRKSLLLELEPRRFWKKHCLSENGSLVIPPNSLILGRVAEKFTIPSDCAGKIEGRSSFARMGLTIHCSGDFINPGYRGHMPIQLYNLSPFRIRVYAGIPICQLKLVKLTSLPERLYGARELQSKYMDDDGGPSYWWRDKRIQQLQAQFQRFNVELEVQESVLEEVGVREPEVIERFEKHVSSIKNSSDLSSSRELIDTFAKKEDRLRARDNVVKNISKVAFPIVMSTAITLHFRGQAASIYFAFTVASLLLSWPFVAAIRELPKSYLGTKEVRESEAEA